MADNKTFEEALNELASIVGKLEDGDMPLDKSLEAFENGIKLVKICEKHLSDAEQRVTLLTGGENGYTETTFSGADN